MREIDLIKKNNSFLFTLGSFFASDELPPLLKIKQRLSNYYSTIKRRKSISRISISIS